MLLTKALATHIITDDCAVRCNALPVYFRNFLAQFTLSHGVVVSLILIRDEASAGCNGAIFH